MLTNWGINGDLSSADFSDATLTANHKICASACPHLARRVVVLLLTLPHSRTPFPFLAAFYYTIMPEADFTGASLYAYEIEFDHAFIPFDNWSGADLVAYSIAFDAYSNLEDSDWTDATLTATSQIDFKDIDMSLADFENAIITSGIDIEVRA